MFKKTSFLFIAITLVVSCQSPKEKIEEPFEKLTKLVDQYAKNTLEKGNINALALAIYKDGKVYKNYYGALDKNENNKPNDSTLFELASISKVFIGTLVSKAVLDGKLKLDDNIQKYLKGDYSNLEYEGFPITIQHLLTHTIGLKNKTPKGFEAINKQISEGYYKNRPFDYDFSDFLEELKTAEVNKKPGSHYAYTTVGPELLSYILQQVYNRPYKELLGEFLNELDLKNTYLHDVGNNKKHIAHGFNNEGKRAEGEKTPLIGSGMFSNLPDLITFMKFQLESDSPIVKEATRKLYTDEDDDGTAYLWEGLATGEEEGFYYSKTGTSYGTQSGILICPDSNYGLILIANSTSDLAFNDWANMFYSKMEVDLIKFPRINLISKLTPLIFEDKNTAIKEFNKLKENKTDFFVYDNLENTINTIGFNLMTSEKTKKKAINIFEFAVAEFPDSFNLFDSLGEAYYENNDYKKALKSYKKSLELNPENENAKTFILKIEAIKRPNIICLIYKMSKLQKVTLSILCLLLLVSVFLFSKLTKSKKYYSPDKQYSVYTKTYVYSEIGCALFSTFECSFAGRVYLFDEIEKENISSIYIKNTKSIETLSWSNIDNTIYFKDSSIEIPEGEFILPRPFKTND